MGKKMAVLAGLAPALLTPLNAYAQTGSGIDAADTAFVLMSAAFVMLMTPGLALFYGGMVRRKNVLGTIMQSFVAIAVVSIQWVLFGYSLAFGPDINGFIGGLQWAGLQGVGGEPNPDYAATVPHVAFMIYQAMFAVITPALIAGAFAERMKFSSFLVFTLLWSTLVYDPVAHWIWGAGGWMKELGVQDFAGGIVVHVTSGISALAAAIIIGKRRGSAHEAFTPHNLPMTAIGAGLLWFGWFGFNAGSALSSGALSAMTFVVTHISAVAATLIWVFVEWIHRGRPTVFGAVTGAVAGLATITPASGFVGPMSGLVIGLLAGGICYIALNMKGRLGYDDSLDAFGVHGVGGILGSIAVGIFGQQLLNPAGADGLLFGNASLLKAQFLGVAITALYSLVMTFILMKVIDKVMGLRVDAETEMTGLDLSQHGESGYTM